MHVIAVNRRNTGRYSREISEMHRLRARVFRDRLDWNVTVSGNMEIDLYDARNPTHLIAVSDNQVLGCVRLLPTTGPNMLANTFPALLDGASAPRSERILESSRFCVDTELCADLSNGLRQATFVMFAAMLEWGLAQDIDVIATVTDARMERILRRAGWPLERLGTSRRIGDTMALAGLLPVTHATLHAVRAAGDLHQPVIADLQPSHPLPLAA